MPSFFRFLSLSLISIVLSLSLSNETGAAEQPPGRFFLMGSGTMHLKNLRNNRDAKVNLLNPDRSLNEEALNKVDWVFDFPTEEKGEHISPRLLFMLSYFADRLAPGKTINIESAYRSPEYNNKIREQGNNAAQTSTHQDGLALDFWLQGVSGKQLWKTIRAKNCCGIGHYGGKIVHLDVGKPRFWEAATSGTRAKEPDYNRHLYLSTDFDRYKPNDRVRLAFSSLSSYDFGVHPLAQVFRVDNLQTPVSGIRIDSKGETDCLRIGERKNARFLNTSLPTHLPPGKYTIRMEFCEKPYEQMPSETFSNTFEKTL
jgi:uncharacterized protein YcbK (DUF882 family)